MAKIDISGIEGYSSMTVEEKLATLEALELPEADYSGYVKKDAFDKTASELAALKKSHNALLSEDERKKAVADEELETMRQELEELKREKLISENKAQFIALGYDETLATDSATALANGDNMKVFANQKKFLDSHDKAVKAELFKNTPTPPPGGAGGAPMNKESIMKIRDMSERQAAIAQNIDLFTRKD